MSETETTDSPKPHQKQLPTPVFFGTIIVAVLGALWLVGRFTPTKTLTPGLSDSALGAASSGSGVTNTDAPPSESPASRVVAPAIVGKTAEGKAFDLKDYKGKVVLLNFWATWCGPCRMEMPELIEIQKKYADKGFTIVGMAEEEDPKKVKDFAATMGLSYPQVMVAQEMAEAYGVNSLPTTFLIDKNGKVIVHLAGVPQEGGVTSLWEPAIEKALAEK
jgi:thiol-disulfide isomerase/thioredoxin